MGYIENNLAPNERVIYETKLHWKIFILPILTLIFAGYLYSDDRTLLAGIFTVGGTLYLLAMAIKYFTNEFVIATNNLYLRQGIFPKTNRIPLTKIARVELKARYNPIDILLDSGGMVCVIDGNEKIEFKNISSPREFDNRANLQLNNPQIESGDQALGGSIQPIKATPASDSELERVQSEFKYYSPARKSYKTAPLPKVGEKWKLERTLPSGQHNVQTNNTHSISWHPTKPLIVTCGWISNLKLWNIETGELITKNPSWSSYSNGNTISWSYDGEAFINDRRIFDGRTGEELKKSAGNSLLFFLGIIFSKPFGYAKYLPGTGRGSYSVERYMSVRGFTYAGICKSESLCTSYLSSSNNFSPWRPNSNQYLISDATLNDVHWREEFFNPWKPHSDDSSSLYRKSLVFRNRRTGDIEKVIDCAVTSQIEDFAWHPKGRFIAVAFKEDNIRIIDIDDVKIVADLSVQNLVGWSPDGKILVGRKEKYKDDFVIWDALETKEKLMPDEMKNELWFKQFFKNICADGLRYIKIESNENYIYSANIYSVSSDELVATLPQEVTAAAWSPIDGGLLATCGGSETHIWRI